MTNNNCARCLWCPFYKFERRKSNDWSTGELTSEQVSPHHFPGNSGSHGNGLWFCVLSSFTYRLRSHLVTRHECVIRAGVATRRWNITQRCPTRSIMFAFFAIPTNILLRKCENFRISVIGMLLEQQHISMTVVSCIVMPECFASLPCLNCYVYCLWSLSFLGLT